MPRANRYFLPGHVWHITHRCHKKEFLLKFLKDRKCWRYWLFEAKKRYVLNCIEKSAKNNQYLHSLLTHLEKLNSLIALIRVASTGSMISANAGSDLSAIQHQHDRNNGCIE